jgi:hypothetical protein
MRQTTFRQRWDARYPIAETLWAVGGVILLLALGDVVLVLVLALAAAALATAWWIRRSAGHRARCSDVAPAGVAHLPTGHREAKMASAHVPWHGHSAA